MRRDEGPRSLKEAVLNSANGLELLIKARLAREHWSLIFSDIDKANYKVLSKGNFISVDFPKATARLEEIVGIPIDQVFKPHLEGLRKLRSRLTHFTAILDPAQAKSLVAKSMNLCVQFCEQESIVSGDVESKVGEIHRNLAVLQEFVDDRMASISQGLKDYEDIWECTECWQEALIANGGDVACAFCRCKADPQELAERNADTLFIEDCPECGEESTFTLVFYNNDGDGRWVCFSCGLSGDEYDHCIRCDQMASFPDQDDVNICSNCWSDMMRSE